MYTYENVHCSQKKFKHPQKMIEVNGISIPCDEKISDAVKLLNDKGYKTKYSCQGDNENNILCYIIFDSDLDKRANDIFKTNKIKYFDIVKVWYVPRSYLLKQYTEEVIETFIENHPDKEYSDSFLNIIREILDVISNTIDNDCKIDISNNIFNESEIKEIRETMNEFLKDKNRWIIIPKSISTQKNLGDKRFKILKSWISSLPDLK